MRYDPAPLPARRQAARRPAALDPIGRAALAESLAGNMPTHIVYCVRKETNLPRRDHRDPGVVPIARETPMADFADRIRGGVLMAQFDALVVPVPMPSLAAAILRRIDGQRSVAEIAEPFAARAFDQAWHQVFTALNGMNRLLLRG